jgi:Ran-binding protein 1
MSSTDNTDKPTEEVKAQEPQTTEGETKPAVTSSSVFSMFGGGAKKEKKDDEDRGDNSGSAKAQREAAAAAKDGEDVSFRCPWLRP